MKQINFNSSFCGSGKTNWYINEITKKPNRYLIAIDRIQAIEELENKVSQLIDIKVNLRAIHSKAGDLKNESSLLCEINNAIDSLSDSPHSILLITHKSLMELEPRSVHERWILIIDEKPPVISSGFLEVPISHEFMSNNYELNFDSEKEISYLSLKPNAFSLSTLLSDCAFKSFANLHSDLEKQRLVVTNFSNWNQVKEKKSFSYKSIWSMRNLRYFNTVYILANGFDKSVEFHFIKNLMKDEISLHPFEIQTGRKWKQRPVKICYFADDHKGTSYFFSSNQGKTFLKKIGEFVHTNEPHIWSTNLKLSNDLKKGKICGDYLSPKQAGSNEYSSVHNATFIYSAKEHPSQADLNKVLGITHKLIQQDREYETIIQFMMRTSLRDSESEHPVNLNVYDISQAIFLSDYLSNNYGFKCELKKLGDGQFVATKKKQTDEEKRDKARMRKQKSRERIKKQSCLTQT